MKEDLAIECLKSFLQIYNEARAENQGTSSVNMSVEPWHREAIEAAMNLMIGDNNTRAEGNDYPENLYIVLGFDVIKELTESQLAGFRYVMENVLTRKEAELIEAKFRDGKTNREIAQEANICHQLASVNIKNVIYKLRLPENLERLAGGNVNCYRDGKGHDTFENEYTILRNIRLKAIEELYKEVEKIENLTQTIREEGDKLGAGECREKANNAVKEILKISIDDTSLSLRALTVLRHADVRYISDLIGWDYERVMSLRNCGKNTADEIVRKAAEYGINIKRPEEV